jgi:hypothetical protein
MRKAPAARGFLFFEARVTVPLNAATRETQNAAISD